MEISVIAVFDACVLYPAPLRNLMMRIADTGFVNTRWKDAIHDEWTRKVLGDNPRVILTRIARMRANMNAAVVDSLVIGLEHLIDSLVLPDPHDRHVLAAAMHCHASTIVTANLKDFPQTVCSVDGLATITQRVYEPIVR